MRSLLLLYLSYFIIYSCFVGAYFVGDAFEEFVENGTECFVLLLGGILAAFVVKANRLFLLSVICFIIGGAIIIVMFAFSNKYHRWIAYALFGICFGLFKFIFLVIMMNQDGYIQINTRIAGWLIVENFCYIVAYTIIPLKQNTTIITMMSLGIIIGVTLLVVGKVNNVYKIDSDIINIVKLRKSIKKSTSILWDGNNNESKNIIISISKATIVLFLLIPFGICDLQNQYSYVYQAQRMKQPQIEFYKHHPTFWFSTMACVVNILIIIFWLIVKEIPLNLVLLVRSNTKYKIIIGNLLMILATFLCGIIETCRSEVYLKNNKTSNPVLYGNETVVITEMSIFYTIPQVVLLAMSEVLMTITCIEFMYKHSVRSVKYLSTAFLFSAIQPGGLSDLLSYVLYYNEIFQNNTYARISLYRLDSALYALSAVALLALLVSIQIMNRFKRYFGNNNSFPDSLDHFENTIYED